VATVASDNKRYLKFRNLPTQLPDNRPIKALCVSQTTEDIQLQVWKDLALSKQLLANEIIKALDLDTTVTATQLKDELNKLIDRANHADANIKSAREKADISINEIRRKIAN